MVVFFIILTILFFSSLSFLLLCLSSLEIEINDFHFDSENKKHHKLDKYLIYIRLKLFNKMTWFKIKIDKEKIRELENSRFFKSKIFNRINKCKDLWDIILKNRKEIFKEKNINFIKELNININKLNLNMGLCTSNSIFTSFAVAVIASVISLILANNIKKYDRTKYNYSITPIYKDELGLKIKLDCIINVKIVHIINVIYMLVKKRRVEYDERTSNRRAYVCSND